MLVTLFNTAQQPYTEFGRRYNNIMAIYSLKSKEVLSNLTAPANIDLGAMIPISTTTVGVSGVSSITFSNIPQIYEHLQIRGILRTNSGGNLVVQFNGDTATNYSYHSLSANGSSVTPNSGSSSSELVLQRQEGLSSTSGMFNGFIIDILDYANTGKYKTLRSLSGVEKNASGNIDLESGSWRSTAAITSIKLERPTLQQYSTLALYGIKRAGA